MVDEREGIYVAGIKGANVPAYASRDLGVVMALIGKEYERAHAGPVQWTQLMIDDTYFRWTATLQDADSLAEWYIEHMVLDTEAAGLE